jgi:hypothetical protein
LGEIMEEQTLATSRLRRRSLIAGAAALVAATVAKRPSQEVAAQGEPLIVGNGAVGPGFQSESVTTTLATSSALTSSPAFRVENFFGSAPDTKGDGIQGFTTGADNAGVFGRNNELNGVAVWGEAPNGTGVFGDSSSGSGVAGNSSTGAGVYGVSNTQYGVFGQINAGPTANTIALFGANLATGTNSHGVIGQASGGNGLIGSSLSSDPNAAGLVGFAGANGARAGAFFGNVAVSGNFAVAGTKSAAVLHPDGSRLLVYSVEAPDSWLEDIGSGTLVGGNSWVQFDPDFAALIHLDDYQVFLTEYGTHFHLSVADRASDGFSVTADMEKAQKNGTAATDLNGTFGWRMIAKRKDVEATRLAPFSMPTPDSSLMDLLQAALISNDEQS